jgi:hypothetical protein
MGSDRRRPLCHQAAQDNKGKADKYLWIQWYSKSRPLVLYRLKMYVVIENMHKHFIPSAGF